jgi:hypothetical protein
VGLLPVLSAPLPPDPSCRYEATPTMTGFEPSVSYAGARGAAV